MLLQQFIKSNRESKLIIEFKAEWCQGSFILKSPFAKLSLKYGQGNFKFASVDVDLTGLDDLNMTRTDLKLGAIPTFCIYENNCLIDRLVTCSPSKLDAFLKSHYLGNILGMEFERIVTEETEQIQHIKRHSRVRLRYKKRIPDESPTRKLCIQRANDIRVAQTDPKLLNDPKYTQMESRVVAALQFNNIDKRYTIDLFRSPSPDKYLDRDFSPDKFLSFGHPHGKYPSRGFSSNKLSNLGHHNDKYPSRGFSPTKYADRCLSPNKLPSLSSHSPDKYPNRGLSPEKFSSQGLQFK